ncbi:hypothetical protein J8G26_11650 [Acidovorax sp. JG5]|uniref:hypothetical protein n=1 Tax=Acidovorax sp. JG5 TaxID=2822718 RepID=UPI001B3273B8|nr:hypothetical protein [Acidovorax sp. JG5]MBP3981383.1 hypothetical protein [Acidovorax sp. JG5]
MLEGTEKHAENETCAPMHQILSFFTTSPEASIVALLILLSAVWSYFLWFKPAKQAVIRDLESLSAAIEENNQSWESARQHARNTIQPGSRVADAWLETEGRAIKVVVGKREEYVMYGTPRDLWSAPGLLARHFNLGLAEAIPNVLVGVGLLFTFVFLSWALVGATTALTEASSSKETEAAISQLLRIAGGKFLTSLAGLVASICWTLFFRHSLNEIAIACEKLLAVLAKVVSPAGGETVTMQQLVLAVSSLQTSNDANGLTEELLSEAREQTGTLKRFETDLAVSLASAINQAFTPQMQAMTERLVASIEGLSDKLGTMNQEALKTMMSDFAGMLKQATDSEMTQLQKTLQELANQLHSAGSVLENQSGMAANAILNAGVEMQTQLKGAGDTLTAQTAEVATAIHNAGTQLAARTQGMSEKLVEGASQLEQATASIRLCFKDLGAVVDQASTKGKEGIEKIHMALEKADFTVVQLSQTASGLSDAAQGLAETGALVSNMVDNVQELAREQRAVVLSVREVAPNAMAAVERVTEVLDQAAAQTLSSMQQTRQAMESTATTLGKTVGSITEGVGVYSTQVAELHRQMDGQLAKAVGSFDQGVKDLSEVVEDLTESLQSTFQAVRG